MQTYPWPLAFYFLIVVALMGALMLLSHFLGERHSAPAADEPFESGVAAVGDAHLRLSAKFYLIAMFFVIFDVEAIFLYAWAVALRDTGWAGFVEALIFVTVLVATLAYLWRLGALDWGPWRGGNSPEQGERSCNGG